MNKINIIAILFILFFSSFIFADEVTTTSSSVTTETTNSSSTSGTPEDATTTTVTTTKTVVKDEDIKIIATIKDKFAKSGALTGTELTIVSTDGIVTISGTVTTQSQADEAVRLAKETAGVNNVISDITVKTKTNPT